MREGARKFSSAWVQFGTGAYASVRIHLQTALVGWNSILQFGGK